MISHNLIALLIVLIFILTNVFCLQKQRNIQDLIFVFFGIYLFCLCYIVTSKQIGYLDSNFTFFREICRYEVYSKLFIKNVIGNILLFIPLGMFLTYKFETKKIYHIFFLTLYFSFFIEVIQLLIGRVFDVDDILLNVVGGLIGYCIYMLFFYLLKILKK